jgi:hypothetical protein
MGVSTENDFSKLEEIQKISLFFDAIMNPEKFVKVVKDAKDILEDYKKIVGPYTTIKAAEDYKSKIEQALREEDAVLSDKYNSIVEREAAFDSKMAQKLTDIARQKAEADQALADLITKERSIQEQYKDIALEKSVLAADKAEFQEFVAQLQKKEQELLDKSEKLKSLLG